MIKKRTTRKIVSTSARCLTDGDKLYENEFVNVPKRRKVNHATVRLPFLDLVFRSNSNFNSIHFISQWNDGAESEPRTVENSPMPSSPFTQPTTPAPSRTPTYATHKLPSFNEMISSHKSPSYSIIATNNNNNNHVTASADNPDGMETASHSTNLIVIPNDDELPVPEPSMPIESIATASESNSLVVTGGGTTIIENPNLTYKSNAEDIMNMDIIFDNVPIEEDPTIGNNVTIIHETTIPAITTNNIHYEVIQLDGANRTDPVIQQRPGNYSQYDESSNEGILVIDESVHTPIDCSEIVLDSNGMEIVSSSPPPPSSQDGVTVEVSSEQEIVDSRIESDIVQSTLAENRVTVAVPSDQMIADENAWPETVTPSLPQIESDIVQSTPEEPEVIKAKRIRKPKSKTEPAVKREKKSKISKDATDDAVATTTTSLKRKQKPLPTLIGRSKKSKTEDSQPPIKPHVDAQNETMECEIVADTLPAEPSSASVQINEQETQPASHDVDATDDAAVSDETNESEANDCMDSLVVVESQDPNDASKTIHEVYFVCPETKKMSDQPLDLPDEVIQRIRLSMMPGAE